MKDIVTSSLDLDINIYVSISNAAEKKIFNCAISAIKYYLSVQPLKSAKFIFLWLAGLNPLIGPSTNLNHTKSKSYNENDNISNGVDIDNRANNKILWADGLFPINVSLFTNSNYTKIEKYFF